MPKVLNNFHLAQLISRQSEDNFVTAGFVTILNIYMDASYETINVLDEKYSNKIKFLAKIL